MKKVIVVLITWLIGLSAFSANLKVIANNQGYNLNADQLLEIQTAHLKTLTPWTQGEPVFKGLELAALFNEFNIHSGRLKITGLNDYEVEVAVQDLLDANGFMAMYQDEKRLKVRNKGPFWIIFPWSEDEGLINSDVVAWAVWQIKTIEHLDD